MAADKTIFEMVRLEPPRRVYLGVEAAIGEAEAWSRYKSIVWPQLDRCRGLYGEVEAGVAAVDFPTGWWPT